MKKQNSCPTTTTKKDNLEQILSQTDTADDVKQQQFIKHVLTASISGRLLFTRSKWLQLFSPVLSECGISLSTFKDGDE